MSISNPFIAITGPTASGKSTIGEMLADYFSYAFIEEEWEDNPHLDSFNKGQGSFLQAELWFIQRDFQRFQIGQELLRQGTGIILDKPFYENHTYVEAAPLSPEDKAHCHKLIEKLSERTSPPNLLLEMKASPRLIMQRISVRGWEVEASLNNEWFERFNAMHESEKHRWPLINTIEISADDKDFMKNNEMLPTLGNEIYKILGI